MIDPVAQDFAGDSMVHDDRSLRVDKCKQQKYRRHALLPPGYRMTNFDGTGRERYGRSIRSYTNLRQTA
jgi:hypothetical protein